MKALFLAIILILPSVRPATAGSVAGTGGSTEYTQILNNVQLANAYAQQVMQYQNQLLEYDTMLKNLATHPLGDMGMTFNTLISNQSRILNYGKDIGSSMSRVDRDFADKFKSPLAGTYADKFKAWSDHSDDFIKAMLLNAGAQRETFQSDEDALKALVEKNRASDGNLGAIKTLGEINAAQLQESMKLRDLISQQQIAQGTYLASETAKEKALRESQAGSMGKATKGSW